ncbi:MAG: type II secretion system protein F [Lachnospiraceae bacterium]|jgi:tight adherence protein B|nr:type II secretion system protein F [Lachnospiraceae bacterium]
MDTSLKRPDYHKCRWKRGEKTGTALICIGITGLFAYFFYRSVWAMIPLSVIGTAAFWQTGRRRAEKQQQELAAQFRECILAVAASLQAGYSVENAFLECRQDMLLMYGEEALICRELNFIKRGLHINISLEELLSDLADRSGCEDIEQFAQIFALAKRNGGNMTEIIRSSAGQIGKQIELRQEIQMLLGGKKMELAIMKVMPFGILLYINMGNRGYFDSLYHNLTGAVIMTGCLAVYLGAYLLGEHIMKGIVARMA